MTNKLLDTSEDGLYIFPYDDDYFIQKLKFLGDYINAFSGSMKYKNWGALNYIDLFSGSGKCCYTERGIQSIYLGSPLLALTSKTPYSQYFFVEKDTEKLEALSQRCSASPRYSTVHLYNDDCNTAIHEILNDIRCLKTNRRMALNLAILDPYSFQLQWKTIELLAQCEKMDMIIYYPESPLDRTLPGQFQKNKSEILDPFFGTSLWREKYKEHMHGKPGKHEALIKLYLKRLRGFGYKYQGQHYPKPPIKNSNNRIIYRLLFVSKHPFGHQLWTKIVKKDLDGNIPLPFPA